MKIVLLGYMASGKSTVGIELANQMNLQFVDLDAYIEKKEKSSIAAIFEDRGELYFRKQEYRYLAEVVEQKSSFVLSVGGGTPCYGKNLELILNSTETVFYLNVPITELAKRLTLQKAQRPLVGSIADEELPEFIGKHLFERSTFYNQAPFVIYCGDKTPKSIIGEIKKHLDSIAQDEN